MNDHPSKHIRDAIDRAIARAWHLVKSGPRAHAWGRLYCPAQSRGGCILTIYGTPQTYEFDVLLKGISEVSDDQADALFAAGCDDGTPASCNGLAWIHFDREGPSLEEALRSAVAQVRAAGFAVCKIELDVDTAVFQPT